MLATVLNISALSSFNTLLEMLDKIPGVGFGVFMPLGFQYSIRDAAILVYAATVELSILPFNTLLEMHARMMSCAIVMSLSISFNTLLEMHHRPSGALPAAYDPAFQYSIRDATWHTTGSRCWSCSFNTLLEMPATSRPCWAMCMRISFQYSIRDAGSVVLTIGEALDLATFNTLLEMPIEAPAGGCRVVEDAFNTLLEMPSISRVGRGTATGLRLSILY